MDAAASSASLPLLQWGVATRTLAGQTVSGDAYLVQPFSGGVLVAVVDGLGHGEEAVTAANLAVTTLAENAHEAVVPLLQGCHEQLHGTRGVVVSIASFRVGEAVMAWAGVGDVEGILMHAVPPDRLVRESLPLRGGVVGYQLPPLRTSTLPVTKGDLLIFATDGVRSNFIEEPLLHNPLLRQAQDGPQQLADQILARYGKETDDALVFVARYLGDSL